MALSACNNEVNATGRENAQHGTPVFPLACYGDNLQMADVPWHWHDEWEAAVVTKGSVLLSVDGETYTLHQGDGFFVNSGVLHAGKPLASGACRLHSLVFHPRLLGNGIDGVYWQKYLQPLLANTALKGVVLQQDGGWQQQALQSTEAAWQACVAETPGYEFTVRSALSTLLFAIIAHATEAPQAPNPKAARDNERIKAMMQFINTHYAEPLTVAGIAASAAISESECLRCFRATLGTAPIKYVKMVRLQKAAELLSQTDMNITAVGDACGFQDMSYFAKAFLQYRGCTPSAYRKQTHE